MVQKKGTATKKKVVKGDAYQCEVCGLSVIVDEACDCGEMCDITCCGKTMKEKKAGTKAKK
jgi:hypothetical protein